MHNKEQFEQAKRLIMAVVEVQVGPVTPIKLLKSLTTRIPERVLRAALWDLIDEKCLTLNQELRVGVSRKTV